ncbi:hypothetical protein [Syntrophus gentianae]|uniref:hypothetical protein n=1 Tax=Syntrophus gentianae TaxID=43775 RepID=UPI000B803A29|nr:hypothetical protein [Syntrophus gentianae]
MNWSEVITHPLGLVAYVLALVFGVVGAKLGARNKPWFLPVAIAISALVILAGIYLAYQNVKLKTISVTPKPPVEHKEVIQETHGVQSPAVHGTDGNVTIINNPRGKGN